VSVTGAAESGAGGDDDQDAAQDAADAVRGKDVERIVDLQPVLDQVDGDETDQAAQRAQRQD